MGNRYHIKSATMTFGSTAFEMASAPGAKGRTREPLETTSLSDAIKQFTPGALTEDDEVTVTLYDKGSGMPTVDDEPAALSFSVTLSNGEDEDVSAGYSYVKAFVTKVSPPNQEATGDRKATIDITFRPTGQQPVSGGGSGSQQ